MLFEWERLFMCVILKRLFIVIYYFPMTRFIRAYTFDYALFF